MPILVMAYLHESNILRDNQIKLMAFKDRAAAASNSVNKAQELYVSFDISVYCLLENERSYYAEKNLNPKEL